MEEKENKKFPGFGKPKENYWQYPRACNGWWHILSGNEQKVLDYILRHTWGYNKTADKISLSQFKNGIKKKNGEWIDKGTGIKKDETILKAIKKLEQIGFIITKQIKGKTKYIELRSLIEIDKPLLRSTETPSPLNGVVTSPFNGDTIKDSTIKDRQLSASADEEIFSLSSYLNKMEKDKKKHIRFIAWYFKKRNSFFPDKKTIKVEIKRWLKDASFIVKYSQNKIASTQKYVEKKYPEEWNLSTIKKFISEK